MSTFNKLKWMGAVRRCTEIPAAQRMVILHVGDTADKHGLNAWRANGKVCSELGVSLDTVKRARKAAVDHGYLVVTKAAPRGSGNTRTTEYRLGIPANGGSSASISTEMVAVESEIGAAVRGNRCSSAPEIGAGEAHPSGSSSGITSGSSSGDTPPPPRPVAENEEQNRYAGTEKDNEPMRSTDKIDAGDVWGHAPELPDDPYACGVCGIDTDDRKNAPEGNTLTWFDRDGTAYHYACRPGPGTRRREKEAATPSRCRNCEKYGDKCFTHGSKKLATVGAHGDYLDDPWGP